MCRLFSHIGTEQYGVGDDRVLLMPQVERDGWRLDARPGTARARPTGRSRKGRPVAATRPKK
jgi:hypothetical protein